MANKQNNVKGLELKFNNELVSETVVLATRLNEYFLNTINEITQHFVNPSNTQVLCNDGPLTNDLDGNVLPQSVARLDIKGIEVKEVLNIISTLRNSKARDEFGFDTNFLKRFKTCFLCPVTHLIN
ncbi:hypothetical protein [Cetobacterium sp.]|uniref:hypothetical protein n=1 Tax=Cetobacterium sp. TaxID=2071632 RepID=UPI003EE61944